MLLLLVGIKTPAVSSANKDDSGDAKPDAEADESNGKEEVEEKEEEELSHHSFIERLEPVMNTKAGEAIK